MKKLPTLVFVFIPVVGFLGEVSGQTVSSSPTSDYVPSAPTSQYNSSSIGNVSSIIRVANDNLFTSNLTPLMVSKMDSCMVCQYSILNNLSRSLTGGYSLTTYQNISPGETRLCLNNENFLGRNVAFIGYEVNVSSSPKTVEKIQCLLSALPFSEMSNKESSVGYDGYAFNHPKPWYCFGGNYRIQWVDQGMKIPSISSPPSNCQCSGIDSGMSGWVALTSSTSFDSMAQAGWSLGVGYSVCLLFQYWYDGSLVFPYIFHQSTSNPVEPGNYLYEYINQVKTCGNTEYFQINLTDTTTHCSYSKCYGTADQFTPNYFGSIAETPTYGSSLSCATMIEQLPYFSQFQVNSLMFYDNGNTVSGGSAWSNGWYTYFCLRQSANGNNMIDSFSASLSGGDGEYNLYWVNSLYSSSYISQQTGGDYT
ncbi:MAG: hypothetical protein M1113_03450 [Candidatus Thermoplasmatota archaeon]|nr:hypothetical protein [Candidatus Thermoplasmatota archaeon]